MSLKKAIILREQITDIDALDQQDSINQAKEVQKSLLENGYEACVLPFSVNMHDLKEKIEEIQPEFVFNLVDGEYPLLHLAPLYLEYLKVPFTGGTSESIFITTHKVFAKKMLKNANIATAKYFTEDDIIDSLAMYKDKLFILKPYNSDASIGIEKDAIVECDGTNIIREISEKSKKYKKKFFAEEFIQGREFIVAMIGSQEEFFVLHPAEILFINYPEGKHKILNYAAKWEESSFEYENTLRTFDFQEKDRPLLEELQRIARQCWKIFGLNGYARLDIRVDEQGQPFVLEINSNPNIISYGSFVAACKKLGWDYNQMIQKIITNLNQ